MCNRTYLKNSSINKNSMCRFLVVVVVPVIVIIIMIIIIKLAKYADFTWSHIFQPIAVENLSPINSATLTYLGNLGRRICTVSGDDREASFLCQRISMMIQCFTSVLLHDSFCTDCPEQQPFQLCF